MGQYASLVIHLAVVRGDTLASKDYTWLDGAVLEEHSRRKHKILREYFHSYIVTRCQLPQQSKFRLAVVDGFSGAGRYRDGSPGSPLIFVEELSSALSEINNRRAVQGLAMIEMECLLILNDAEVEAISLLRQEVSAYQAGLVAQTPRLLLHVEYLSEPFERAYPLIKETLSKSRYQNIIFNLDQCGHSKVEHSTLLDIMRSRQSVEIFYTFAIESLIAFLSNSDPHLLASQLAHVGLNSSDLDRLEGEMRKDEWLALAEQLVFAAFNTRAPFVSPFSIRNPKGWRYWFIHFANSYRARQVYNNILHQNSSSQAHFGRFGLHMLSYDPSNEGMLYLFDEPGRETARSQLYEDIPRLVAESSDAMLVRDFYEQVYNATPAHAEDINSAIIESPDIEVITSDGGKRRSGRTIDPNDVLRLKNQRSFFPLLGISAPKKLR